MSTVRTTPNWQVFYFSLIAITRGVLYAVPSTERLPPGLSLLPPDFIAIYGLIWLGAGSFGVCSAFTHRANRLARYLIAGMCVVWASAYALAAVTVDTHSWSGAAFFVAIAGAVYSKQPKELMVEVQRSEIDD